MRGGNHAINGLTYYHGRSLETIDPRISTSLQCRDGARRVLPTREKLLAPGERLYSFVVSMFYQSFDG